MEPLKGLIVLLLVAVVASLGRALFHLSSGPEHSERMVRALTVRISLSIALFVLVMIAWYAGKLSPHGLS